MRNLLKLLEQTPLFSTLPADDLARIAHQAIPHHYEPGEKIVLCGEVWPYFMLIGQGKVDAIKESAEGRSLLVTTFGSGEVFWGMAFFLEEASMLVTLEARTACELYLWKRDDLQPILMKNGRILWELSRLMVSRMVYASEMLESLAFQPVAGRLARLLLDYWGEGAQSRLPRQLTLDEMAARIGSTREMVCRLLHRFQDSGAIQITRTEFVIANRETLTSLAQESK